MEDVLVVQHVSVYNEQKRLILMSTWKHASYPLLAMVTAVLATDIIGTVITRYWKISFHLVGMAGAVTVLWTLFGSVATLLTPTVLLVAWARWRVGAHTPLQALAVSVALGTCWLFDMR